MVSNRWSLCAYILHQIGEDECFRFKTRSLSVSAEVTDNDGSTAREFVTVKVLEKKNTAPNARVIDNSIVVRFPETRALLNGSNSSDPDGRIVRYEWKKVQGPGAHISYTKMPRTYISRLSPGTYRFELTVTDNTGDTDKSYVTVKVVR